MTASSLTFAGRPVAFCGFMGSGKTTIGRRVARSLGRAFFDCDELIEHRLGRTIPEIFGAGDVPLFRRTEAALVADLVLERPPVVISLGGGALEDPETRELVYGSTAAVYLDRPLDAILRSLDRLRATRPLLAGGSDEEIAALYAERVEAFRACPIVVTVGDHDIDRVVGDVLAALAGHGLVQTDGE